MITATGTDTPGNGLTPVARRAVDRRLRALVRHVDRLDRIHAGSGSHPVVLRGVGQYWRERREESGIPAGTAARKVGIAYDELSLFEAGLLDVADLPEGFVDRLAEAIGRSDAIPAYEQLFPQHRPST